MGAKDIKKGSSNGLGLTFRRDGRFIVVGGRIDEFADYGPLLLAEPPLKLVLRDVRDINSHGLRRWIQFIGKWGLKTIEFHECPAVFVEMANLIGDLVSPNGNMKRIKSVLVPVQCIPCDKMGTRIVQVTDVIYHSETSAEVAMLPCTRCQTPVESLVALDDFFWFSQLTD